MFKRVLSMILVLITLSAPLLGRAGTVHAATTDDMESSIEKQIRVFADSIDQANADDKAASALATHGITGRGKTLNAGKTHALTATLLNSELLQNALTDTCVAAIRYMHRFNTDATLQLKGNSCWYGADSFYFSAIYSADASGLSSTDRLHTTSPYTGKLNSYDNALDWMAANSVYRVTVQRTKLTTTEAVYSITCKVLDRFDFSTSSGSGFQNLISAGAAFLFREFDWEASASFQLKLSADLIEDYCCTHSPQMYRWTYDRETKAMANDASGAYAENDVVSHTRQDEDTGKYSYYYELDKPVRLYHNEPWVLEYDVRNPGFFVLAPLRTTVNDTHFSLMIRSRQNLWFRDHDYVTLSDSDVKKYGLSGNNQYAYNYYGTPLDSLFTYNTKNIYTMHLENEVNPDGSNMVYLTVHNKDTGELLLDKAPMDDYTRYDAWIKEYVLKNESDNWISGKDFYINYIGNNTYPFSASYFELRIWEQGIGSEAESYCKTKVTKPTCTTQGYTTYTCSHCGYSYQTEKVKATGHSYGEWKVVIPATCTEPGEEQRKCKNCDAFETREIAATGHNYDNYVCINCSDTLYTPGDVDMNGSIDVDDVLALLWNVLFPEDYPIEVDADFDSNGAADVDDVLTLLWHVLFPEDYPLN